VKRTLRSRAGEPDTASNQAPIQKRILVPADIWDRVEHPAREARAPEAAWDQAAVPGRAEAAADGKGDAALTMFGWRQETICVSCLK
jgi:hypothetical protein